MILQRTGLGLILLGMILSLVTLIALPARGTAPEMITICHAAGQAGTTMFVEITAAAPAIFGEAGHFFENGTPRAGHEEDTLGPCPVVTTTTQADEETTTSTEETTTLPEETTTTEAPPPPPPPTTVPGETTTTEGVTTSTLVLELGAVEAVCVSDIPFLSYSVDFPDAVEVDITFVNPDGPDLVYENQPIAGFVLWPGASVEPPDWPGWILVNGIWEEGDDGFLWARETITVIFEVNPTATTEVSYPPPSAICAGPTNPPGTPPGTLPFTGLAEEMGLLSLALAFLGGGLLLIGKMMNRTE